MKYLSIALLMALFMPCYAHAAEITADPICFNIINDSDQTIYGSVVTDYVTREDGQKIHYDGTFRLAPKETTDPETGYRKDFSEFCSRGPFFPGRQLQITLRTLIPVFSCKTSVEAGDIIVHSKKIENVEFLIKLEQKNKSQLEDNFETKISKLDNTIERNERELEKTLKELNVKESKIFELQKAKLESFKKEIIKFETIYKEIEERLEEIFVTINTIKQEECNVYNRTFIINEDYLSYCNELTILKQKMKDLKEVLIGIEKSFPKEFEFLLEDIQIEKDLKAIIDKKSNTFLLSYRKCVKHNKRKGKDEGNLKPKERQTKRRHKKNSL